MAADERCIPVSRGLESRRRLRRMVVRPLAGHIYWRRVEQLEQLDTCFAALEAGRRAQRPPRAQSGTMGMAKCMFVVVLVVVEPMLVVLILVLIMMLVLGLVPLLLADVVRVVLESSNMLVRQVYSLHTVDIERDLAQLVTRMQMAMMVLMIDLGSSMWDKRDVEASEEAVGDSAGEDGWARYMWTALVS